MIRSLCRRCISCGWVALLLVSAPALAVAQTRGGEGAAAAAEGPPIHGGRLLEIETKGRVTTLNIESSDGNTYEVKVTPRLEFSVVGKGDAGFVQPGVFLVARGNLTNDKIFVNKATIHLLPKGKRAPPGRVQKVAAQPGESTTLWDVAGEIASVGPADGYPDLTAVEIKATGRVPPVWLEKDFEVEVASSDPAHATVGADLELAMKPLPGGRFLPVGVRIQREAPFNSAELLTNDK